MNASASRTAVLLALAVTLAACEYHRTITYPKVPVAGATEAGFDCAQLDDAILKTDAVRWVMREDKARLLSPTERAMRTTSDATIGVAMAIACLFCISPAILSDEGHHVLDGVDKRLLSLLALKDDKDCEPSPTAIAGMSDLQMHQAVASLVAREDEKLPDDDMKALLAERMRLLDHLRP